MKRRCLNETPANAGTYVPNDIPEDLRDYADELRLLKGIPLTYLLADPASLSAESIRFFVLDVNWTDSLLDGAFSLGRVCMRDIASDQLALAAVSKSREYQHTPRMKRMHPNHKPVANPTANADVDFQIVSGFILRSELVKRMKGLHLHGFDAAGAPTADDEGTPLPILRMDLVADDIMLCLFAGRVHEIMISEPQMGLCFGVSTVDDKGGNVSRRIDLRSTLESPDIGKRIESFCIDRYTDENGRLHARDLAVAIEEKLKQHQKLGVDKITPSRFAFEMIAVANRALFMEQGAIRNTEQAR
ncbi:MAG: hypothetical protein LBC96_10285 [Lachnospiraceae bacterium]|nr:hypothetical protein [Lachnospiraceae bacterium]